VSPNNMNAMVIILAIVAVVAIGVAAWMYMQKNKTQALRTKFGPEYDKAVDIHKDRSHAESELEKRAKRVAEFHIRPLREDERARYAEDWRVEQSLFVDDPRAAVKHADILVQDVMKHRGYPVSDFEQNAADLSVDHPRVVENYRIAHDIAIRDAQGQSSTEDLRKAMISYRSLFDELLEQHVEKPEEVRK
jgi:FtsZ-interacting cell division protein ZipA